MWTVINEGCSITYRNGKGFSTPCLTKEMVEEYVAKSPDLFNLKVTPHVLRHCKAVILIQINVNIIYIRGFLGHVSVSTTEIYANANPELKRKAIEKAIKGIHPKNKYTKEEIKSMLDWLKNII
jgi:integrase/recombinase XerD